MSRTGIHGGIRRGAAAAAVGAVLVLSTGVQASLADDAAPPPRDPAAEAARTRDPKAPSILAVPGALVPAVKATLSTATPTATADASAGALPVPGLPLPTVSVTPLAPGATSSPSAAPTGTTSSPVPATSGSSSKAGSSTASGSTSRQSSAAAPAAGAAPGSGAAPAAGPATPEAAAQAETGQVEAGQGDAGQGDAGQGGPAGTGAEAASPPWGATAGATPAPALPTALSINARHSQPTREPQAAAAPAGPGRAVSSTRPLPDLQAPMVWLGAGLIGVGAAAGLVFVRMRRPF